MVFGWRWTYLGSRLGLQAVGLALQHRFVSVAVAGPGSVCVVLVVEVVLELELEPELDTQVCSHGSRKVVAQV